MPIRRISEQLYRASIEIDLRIKTLDSTPRQVVAAAEAADAAGFSAIWLSDQLTGTVSGGRWCLECWTMLAAIAARTERIMFGPLVLNPANRDAGTLAVAIATLQGLASGRLLLGIGAGTGPNTRFSQDQFALGRRPASDPTRREEMLRWLEAMRAVWGDPESGFYPLHPPPPIIVGAFGPKLAALAARHGDGIAVPIDGFVLRPIPMEDLVDVARERRREAGGSELITVVHATPDSDFREPRWRAGSAERTRLERKNIDRLVLQTNADADVIREHGRSLIEDR